MTQVIPEVSGNVTNITNAEFVKLTIYNDYANTDAANLTANTTYIITFSGNTPWTTLGANSNSVGTYFTANSNIANTTGNAANVTVLTFSSSYKDEVIGAYTYDALGGLLAVGAQPRDLRVTQADTTVELSGIPANNNNITTVLATKIRGSKLEILRGFYNNNMVLTNTYPRFTGIVTNYQIVENREGQQDNFTVSVGASSYKTVLENRIAGRKTNKESWRYYNPTDASMDNVYSLSGVQFDFGQKPSGKVVTPGYGGGGTTPGGGFTPGGPSSPMIQP